MDRPPLKIFMTDPHLSGGGQVRYVTNLAGELTRMGHEVTIGCKPNSILVEKAREARCACNNRFTFKGGLRFGTWRNDLAEMRRVIREERPDIIHVSGSQDHWVCALANRLLGRPVCLVRTRHNTYIVGDHLPNQILNRRWTDYQIVVCDAVRRTLAQQNAFDGARMCAIHNGVDAEEYRPDPAARERTRAEFGYEPQHLVFGIVARLVIAKGHTYLFQAVAGLRQEYPALRVLVLGQGDLEQELRNLARDLGIEDLVRFAGFRNDMAACVQAMDIGVQPSIDCDTSSFSMKEEMAAEKPVVASDHGGLTEIVTDGIEGFVAPAGTVEPLASALERLLAEDGLRVRMGRAGRERVLRDFTVQVFAQRTAEAYYRALEIHHERSSH
jgi:glycosyltransferase involved in cell wall biosynthesis